MSLRLDNNKLETKEIELSQKILRGYIDQFGYNESDILKKLRNETSQLGPISIMQIGAVQGVLISILCRLGKFMNCIEIGVFTGYSSICIANSIPNNAKLFALDNSKMYTDIAQKYWKLAEVDKKIKLFLDDALKTLDTFISNNLSGTFDFIFIDADKNNYIEYYEKSLLLLKPLGIMIIDNTIWKGRILDETDQSKSTISIRKLNQHIQSDKRVTHCLVSIYDGMTICIKNE